MSNTDRLAGKIALIAGASGAIGSHVAKVLATEGVRVAIAARRTEALDALAREIAVFAAPPFLQAVDVRSGTSVSTCVAAVVAGLGPIDVLVNAFGVTIHKPILEQTEADWDSCLDTNLKGAFLLSTEVARALRAADHGSSIINIASVLGVRQAGSVTPHAVSKAGVVQLTKQLALELARYRIRVNAIAPGYIETDLNREFLQSEAGQKLIRRIPQRRLGSLADLDGIVRLLASNQSRHMTGAVIAVDGGHVVSSL
jgi:NAD(P)-dependent dehydrogenase (short-subunit alcohol dehydrogenase family)